MAEPHDCNQDFVYRAPCGCSVTFWGQHQCNLYLVSADSHHGQQPDHCSDRFMDELLRTAKHELEEALHGYCQHQWTGQRRGGDPADAGSYEWVSYCALCGMEEPGSWW
jgi:hypothetical protein